MFAKKNVQEFNVIVDGGYKPANLKLKAGIPAKITFTRKSDLGCLEEVILNGEKRTLTINTPETFEFIPNNKGEFEWTCGMKMAKGNYTVK